MTHTIRRQLRSRLPSSFLILAVPFSAIGYLFLSNKFRPIQHSLKFQPPRPPSSFCLPYDKDYPVVSPIFNYFFSASFYSSRFQSYRPQLVSGVITINFFFIARTRFHVWNILIWSSHFHFGCIHLVPPRKRSRLQTIAHLCCSQAEY